MFEKDSLETTEESHSKVPRTAGFWSVLFMTVGIQFAGMTVGWNGGASYGLGYMILTNAVIGLMYVLLTLCFAELTSIVAFPGGSFGYCRASLGPFWGFMVGVTEMFDNFIVVMISALSVGSTCTELFGTSRDIEPVWYLIFYLILYGVHLRGGILLWYFIITCGIFVTVLIAIYCCGLVSAIDVNKYCVPNGNSGDSFIGGSRGFMESLVFPVWFYLGVELVPQTCDRVKNVNVNLPRGMILGNLLSVLVSFWVIVAASCTFPGLSDDFAASPLPLIPGYYRIFESTKSIGAIIAIVSIFSVSIGYMWGCGYQVSSLAQSGLLPRVLSSTFGVNNTPYFTLALSSISQVIVCVLLWKYAPLVGPPLLLQTVIIGASLVYVSIFCAFIVFRLRFGAMKRHWKSPVGISGAVVGIILSLLLFLSAVGFQGSTDSLIVYVVYMACAALYYVTYAQYRQYFSPDEQKHFMKAYILNAKNTKSRSMKKGPSIWSSHMLIVPMQRLLEIPASMMGSGRQSSHSGSVSNHSLSLQKPTPSSSSSQTWKKYYVVAPEPSSSPTFDFIVSNVDSLYREDIPDTDSFERIAEHKQSSPTSLMSSPTADLAAVDSPPASTNISTTQHQPRRYSAGNSSARHSDHLSLNNNIVAVASPRSDEVVDLV